MSDQPKEDNKKSNKHFGENFGEYAGEKKGGVHAGDPLGGRYDKKDREGNVTDRYLIKREMQDASNDIAEYMASKIFAAVAPGQGAELEIVRREDMQQGGNNNPFLASKFFQDNYKDFYQEAGYKERPRALEAIQSNLPDSGQYMKQELNQDKYTGYEAAIVASILIGDYSMHSGNMGVIDARHKDGENKGEKIDNKREIVRIDFGAAFREETFQTEIDPYKSNKEHMFGVGPLKIENEKNYFLRDHPEEKIISQEFADELKRLSSRETTDRLKEAVTKAWQEIDEQFTSQAKEDFGKRIGAKTTQEIPEKLQERLEARQQGLQNMATEIELKLINEPRYHYSNEKEATRARIAEIVKENPHHAEKLLEGKGGSEMHLSYSKELKKELKQAVEDYKQQNPEKTISTQQNDVQNKADKNTSNPALTDKENSVDSQWKTASKTKENQSQVEPNFSKDSETQSNWKTATKETSSLATHRKKTSEQNPEQIQNMSSKKNIKIGDYSENKTSKTKDNSSTIRKLTNKSIKISQENVEKISPKLMKEVQKIAQQVEKVKSGVKSAVKSVRNSIKSRGDNGPSL